MGKKQDIDIEKIKEKLHDSALSPEWNNEGVWAAIETKKPRMLPIWKFAAAAAILCLFSFGFWFMLTPNEEPILATLLDTSVNEVSKNSAKAELIIIEEDVIPNAIIRKTVKPRPKSIQKIQIVLKKENIEPSKEKKIVEQKVEVASATLIAVKGEYFIEEEEIELAMVQKLITSKGQKITLIIPKEETPQRNGILGFVQKIGKFNQTGEWGKKQKGTFWAKFVESTKTEKL